MNTSSEPYSIELSDTDDLNFKIEISNPEVLGVKKETLIEDSYEAYKKQFHKDMLISYSLFPNTEHFTKTIEHYIDKQYETDNLITLREAGKLIIQNPSKKNGGSDERFEFKALLLGHSLCLTHAEITDTEYRLKVDTQVNTLKDAFPEDLLTPYYEEYLEYIQEKCEEESIKSTYKLVSHLEEESFIIPNYHPTLGNLDLFKVVTQQQLLRYDSFDPT
jgi:hypothetical protein